MTELEKKRVLALRDKDYSYSMIAKEVGVSENTIKSFFRRVSVITTDKSEMVCLNCGEPISLIPHKKVRKFCSGKCRTYWWRKQQKNPIQALSKSEE